MINILLTQWLKSIENKQPQGVSDPSDVDLCDERRMMPIRRAVKSGSAEFAVVTEVWKIVYNSLKNRMVS